MKTLMTILEFRHLDREGRVLYERKNIKNVVHEQAEEFFINALFSTSDATVPSVYYCGLDNRTSPAYEDTLANLSNEPTQFGYTRQAVSSSSGFNIALNSSDVWQATSNVLTFVASGGTWGPVKNVFLATTANNTGILLATAALDGTRILSDGESTTLRMGITLRDASNAVFV